MNINKERLVLLIIYITERRRVLPGVSMHKERPVLLSIYITERHLVLPGVNINKERPVLVGIYITERRMVVPGVNISKEHPVLPSIYITERSLVVPGANIYKVRPVLLSINITARRLVLPSVNIYKVRPVLLNFYITERRIGYGGIVSVRFVECIFCCLFPASVSTSAPLPPLLASRASLAPLPRRLTGAGGAGLLLLAAGPRALSPALPPGSTLEPAHSREECRKPGLGP